MGAAKRRRRQFAINFRHIARLGRPIYRRRRLLSVSEAISRERARASAEAKRKAKKR